jgi:hypothetical protein
MLYLQQDPARVLQGGRGAVHPRALAVVRQRVVADELEVGQQVAPGTVLPPPQPFPHVRKAQRVLREAEVPAGAGQEASVT